MYLAVISVLFAKVLSKLTVMCDVLQFKYFASLAEKSLFWPIFLGGRGRVPLELLIHVPYMHMKRLKFVIERTGKWY